MEGPNATTRDEKNIAASVEVASLPAAHLDELIATSRALHDVVLELYELLRDPSRSAAYYAPKLVATPTSESRPISVRKLVTTPRQLTKDDPDWVETVRLVGLTARDSIFNLQAKEALEQENARARERHQERRVKEMKLLKSKASYKCWCEPTHLTVPD